MVRQTTQSTFHPMKTSLNSNRPARLAGFTLVELLVSTALIALLMLLLLGTVDQTQNVWKRTTAKIAQFQASRAAFEAMNRRLSQATLNTYYRATDTQTGNAKAEYLFRRQSELQFISGHLANAKTDSGTIPGIFTAAPSIAGLTRPVERAYPTHGVFFYAPLGLTEESGPNGSGFEATRRFRGLDAMLTACGYFIEYGDDPWRPKVLPLATETDPGVPPRIRFRLMELSVPAEELMIFHREKSVDGKLYDPNLFVPANPTSVPPTPAVNWPWDYSPTPQVLNRTFGHYVGRTKTSGNPPNEKIESNSTWVRPYWMENGNNLGAFQRITTNSANSVSRFGYARVMADNVIALVILPKISEKDRGLTAANEIGSLAPEYQYDSWRVLKQDTGSAGMANAARDNKLPPIVQVVMVAIDETSALNFAKTANIPDWTIRDRQLFTKVKTDTNLLDDLAELETRLQKDKVNYRVFSTDVVLRSSKWSKDPSK